MCVIIEFKQIFYKKNSSLKIENHFLTKVWLMTNYLKTKYLFREERPCRASHRN